MAASSTLRPKRRLRGFLAALISLALTMSFFHGWSSGGEDVAPAVVSALATCDGYGKIPADVPAHHGDHCLSHVMAVAPQEAAATIEYVASAHRLAIASPLATTDPASPFKPPRA